MSAKKDDETGLGSYYNNKTTILQEARVFNDSPISPRKCRALLTRTVYLLYLGENLTTQEATTVFFGTTKLFQNKDVRTHCCAKAICLPLVLNSSARETLLPSGCITTNGVPCNQRTRELGREHDHGHKQYHEGYSAKPGSHLSS